MADAIALDRTFQEQMVPKFLIFFVGIVPLVFFSNGLRETLGDPISLVVAIAYIVLMRFIAEKLGR